MAPKDNDPRISPVVRRQMRSGIVVRENGKYRFRGEKRSEPIPDHGSRWMKCRRKKGKD